MPRQILFFVWVTLNEQKWVTFGERRSRIGQRIAIFAAPNHSFEQMHDGGKLTSLYLVEQLMRKLSINGHCALLSAYSSQRAKAVLRPKI